MGDVAAGPAHEGGSQALIQRLKDPALRPRLENEINHGIAGTNWYDHYTATGGWEGMLLVSLKNPEYKRFQGKRMNEVIQAMGKPGIDTLFDLLIHNNGSVPTVYFHHSEEDMRYALKQPWASSVPKSSGRLSSPAGRIPPEAPPGR